MVKSRPELDKASARLAKMAFLVFSLALLPIFGVLVSSGLAQMLGCSLDESGQHACLFLGQDIGGLLNTLFVLGWLGIVTLPVAAIAAVILAAALLTRLGLRLFGKDA